MASVSKPFFYFPASQGGQIPQNVTTALKVGVPILIAFGVIYAGIKTGFFAAAIYLITTSFALQCTLIATAIVVSLVIIGLLYRAYSADKILPPQSVEQVFIAAENTKINDIVTLLDTGHFTRVDGCERRAPKPLYSQDELQHIQIANLGKNLRSIFAQIPLSDLSMKARTNILDYLEGRLQLFLDADGYKEAYQEIKTLFTIISEQFLDQKALQANKEQITRSMNILGSVMDAGTCVTIVLTHVETEYRKFKGDYTVEVYCDSIMSEVKSQILLSYKQDKVFLDAHGLNQLKNDLETDLGFNTKYAKLDKTQSGMRWDPIKAKAHFYTIWNTISLLDSLRVSSEPAGFQLLFDLTKIALRNKGIEISENDNGDILALFFEDTRVNGRDTTALNERGAKLLLFAGNYLELSVSNSH